MLKKIFLFLLPPFFAIAAFLAVVFYVNRDPGKGALQITASPKSAVFLNDKLIGETPLCKCEGKDILQSGTYTVKLVPKEGNIPPYEEHITVGSSVLTVVDRIFGDGGLSEGKVITLTKIADANASECVSLKNNLRLRSRDASTNGEVTILQRFLQSGGYLSVEPDGNFGPLTLQAVIAFQVANGISPANGYIGRNNRNIISSLTGCNN